LLDLFRQRGAERIDLLRLVSQAAEAGEADGSPD
jgi:hypothetical protein